MSKVNKIVIKGTEYELEDSRVDTLLQDMQEMQDEVTSIGDIINDEAPSSTTTYSSNKIASLVDNLTLGLTFKVVSRLPEASDADTNIIYLLRREESEAKNIYDEYLYVNGWEKIGNTDTNLAEYLKAADANAMYVKKTTLESYPTKTEVQEMIDNLPDDKDTKYKGSDTISIDNTDNSIHVIPQAAAANLKQYLDYTAGDSTVTIDPVNRTIKVNQNNINVSSEQVQSDWGETDTASKAYIKNKPTIFSGSYADLSDKPTIPSEQIQSDYKQTNTSAKDYIKNKPTFTDGLEDDNGNISISKATKYAIGGVKVGNGLSVSTDGTVSVNPLETAVTIAGNEGSTNIIKDIVKDTLTQGTGIKIQNGVISCTVEDHDTTYTAGTNIQISNTNVISATDTKYTGDGTTVTISNANVISAVQPDLSDYVTTGDLNTAISNTMTSFASSTSRMYFHTAASISNSLNRLSTSSLKANDVVVITDVTTQLSYTYNGNTKTWTGPLDFDLMFRWTGLRFVPMFYSVQ